MTVFVGSGTSTTTTELGEKRPTEADDPELPVKKFKLLEKMEAQFKVVEPKGPKILDKLATSITSCLRNIPDQSKTDELFKTSLPPENCSGLEMIKVNLPVWRCIGTEARSRDLKIQRSHSAMIRGMTAVAQGMDKLYRKWDDTTHTLAEQDNKRKLFRT